MASAPYGVRLLVGAAATAVEETRKLPQTILTYPMTVVSQLAHLVMKVQQDVADLVIKGDATLENLFPPKDEQPEWATFDEDERRHRGFRGRRTRPRRTEGRFALYSMPDPSEADGERQQARGRRTPLGRGSSGRSPGSSTTTTSPWPSCEPACSRCRCRRTRGAAGLRGGRPRPAPRSRRCWPTGSPARPRSDSPAQVPQGQSAENPFPVRAVAIRVAGWIDKLGMVWVEGQITQLNMRPDSSTVFMVLRDPAADMSLSISCSRDLVLNAPVKLTEGTQVVVLGKPSFYTGRGSFSLRVSEIRAVGVGELLARIERLRRLLEAEGLFDPRLKRPLPFLPTTIGLITGRASAAEHDVTTVSANRWPAVRFAVRNTAVQGPNAVAQIVEALRELDADPDVDVIVIARGGGSVEDLLPFSDETLCRAISACTTPVVSAVGHEPDNPLCDLVADLRAATPTDAAKRIVPDAAAEQALVGDLRRRSARALRNWVSREERHVAPTAQQAGAGRSAADAGRPRRRNPSGTHGNPPRHHRLITTESDRVGHLSARLGTLGPSATLARGYAVVQVGPTGVADGGRCPAGHRIADPRVRRCRDGREPRGV